MSAIDEVKQKTDIVEVIGQYVSLSKSGRTFRGLCPFHSEKHPSFFVYPEQGSWHCFGACNTGGDVFSFIMRKEGIDFGEALRQLAERAGVSLPSRAEPGVRRDEKERLYQVNEAAAQYFHDLLLNSPAAERARNYVASRGLALETVTKFKLGYSLNSWEALQKHLMEIGYAKDELTAAGLIIEAESGETHDRFRNRLMFPLSDLKGNVTGFGARVLDDSLPKYLNSPQTIVFDKSSTLYGINLAAPAIRTQDTVVIVEGYLDVITAHQHGFDNVIASMGTAVTEKQINILKKMAKSIVLAMDRDEAGEEAMRIGLVYQKILEYDDRMKKASGNIITRESEVRICVLPPNKDPDEVIKESEELWQKLISKSIPIFDYIFDLEIKGLDLTNVRDKSLAVERLGPFIKNIYNQVSQAHYLQKLARLVNVTERRLGAELARLKPAPVRRRGEAPKQEAASQTLRPMLSSPIEEYCLALLLQYPELKRYEAQPSPEHFENSENREIFTSWHQASDLPALKTSLDPALQEHLDYLLDYLKKKEMPTNQIERRYADCVLNLRKKYLQSLEVRRAEIFALEVELKGAGADIARLEEEGIEPAIQLKEVFSQKRGKHQGVKK